MTHAHTHDHSRPGSTRALRIVLALTGAFLVAAVIGGIVSGSLALLADAGHMLSDVVSLVAISIWIFIEAGMRLGDRPKWRAGSCS